MKNWKGSMTIIIAVVMAVSLVLSTFAFSTCGEETDDVWQVREPTIIQLALLEKIYDELYAFDYYEDKIEVKWGGPLKQRFDQLCGEEISVMIEVGAEDFQIPEETLRKRRGDCTDFANLFVSAARYLGISSRVVLGEVEIDGEPEDHAWSQIYYKGEWRDINPRSRIGEYRIPFSHQLEGLMSLRIHEVHCRYNEALFDGEPFIELLEDDKEKNRLDFFYGISNLFQESRGREPSEEEVLELQGMAGDVVDQVWREIIKHTPEDHRVLIQADNPEIKAWVEGMRQRKSTVESWGLTEIGVSSFCLFNLK